MKRIRNTADNCFVEAAEQEKLTTEKELGTVMAARAKAEGVKVAAVADKKRIGITNI